ncbi:pentatricopeptide repeat-containing protein [Pyrus ussuriensis x Pyrus communis]|uniref:Pentatricopeptide repeat-containing protein n=1 Tax=Pyrus ussuriensis x Pyrus communis TaxID=2448454 RepID=A0A5N5HTG1_9ROSA|nr:pentatricopeptide repeat-containing protein [Pyrus ussuriensis x Pyrus communis]
MQRVASLLPQSVKAPKKNKIQVSNNKKPFFFYVNLAKRYIKQYKETQYSGSDCGGFFDILIMAKWLLFVQDYKSWELFRNGSVNSLISILFFGMEERLDMGVVQMFVEMPNSKVSCEVFMAALTELLWDQLKTKRTRSRSSSKVKQPFSSRFMDDLLAFLDGSEDTTNECIVCVVIHNIDGLG